MWHNYVVFLMLQGASRGHCRFRYNWAHWAKACSLFFTHPLAVVRFGISSEPRSTELTLVSTGIVDALEAVACVRVTDLGGATRVCITAAVAGNAGTRHFVEASAALVTLWAAVLMKALVTHWGTTGIWTWKRVETVTVRNRTPTFVRKKENSNRNNQKEHKITHSTQEQ